MMISVLCQAGIKDNLFAYYLEKLATPEGVLITSIGLILTSMTLVFDRLKWPLLAFAIYAATYSTNRADGTLPNPFHAISSVGQPLTLGLIILLAVASLRNVPWHRQRILHLPLLALATFQLVFTFRQMFGALPIKGMISLGSYSLMFFVLGIGMNRWLKDASHLRTLAKALAWGGGLLSLSTVVLYLWNPAYAYAGPRFAGPTDNPQRLATGLALTLPFCLMLAADPQNKRMSRVLYAGLGSLAVMLVVLAGSRTGVLAVAVAVLLFFRLRLRRLAIFGIIAAAMAFVVLQTTQHEIDRSRDLLLRTYDSRTPYWMRSINVFLEAPIFGSESEEAAVESSFISAAAMTGIVGLVPVLVLTGSLCWSGARLLRRANSAGIYAPACNAAIAAIGVNLVVWTFEAFLVSLVTNTVIMLYGLLAMIALLEENLVQLPLEDAVSENIWEGGQTSLA